jgi:hypothetical protein
VFIDESGRDNKYYFFGGLIVDSDAARSVEEGLNSIAALLVENIPGFQRSTEFHATEMFHGAGCWKGVPIGWRVKACELVAKVIERSGGEFIFRGIDLDKLRARYIDPYPEHLLTLAHLLGEIDSRLRDIHDDIAIVHADDHHSATNSRRRLVDFKIRRVPGYTQRRLTNLVDTIYFGPSHASRLLQAADVATFFLNRHRTIVEKDSRARDAVSRVAGRIRKATASEYVWTP